MSTDTIGALLILGLIAAGVVGVFAVVRVRDRHEVETDNPPISQVAMHKLLSRVREEESTYPFKQTH